MKQVVVVAAMLTMLFVTACGGLPGVSSATATPTKAPTASIPTQAPSPTAAPTATPTSLPTPTLGSPLDVLTKAFKGMGSVKAFRAQITTTTTAVKTGGTSPVTIEVVLPDRYHWISKQTELIMIGKTVYVKVGTKWQRAATLPLGIDLSSADPKKLESNLGVSKDIKLVGTDDVDGTPTIVYQYTTTLKGPPAQTFTTKLWVGAVDGLPRKREFELKSGQKTTILYTDYNGSIAINAPI